MKDQARIINQIKTYGENLTTKLNSVTRFDGLHLFIKTFAVLQGPP